MADIRSELKNAMLENMANDPSSGVLKKGRVIFNSTSGKARMYNGVTWEDLGSSGGGVATAPAGEYIDCTDKPRSVCLSEKACIEIPTGKYIDLDEGSGEISIDCSSLAGTYFLFDLDTSGDEFDFTESLQTLLNDNVSTTITYNVSYDKSTRKITIADNAASTNFTLKWSTGTNTANTIGEYLGFTISADDSGANTYTADSEIIESAGYDTKTFIFMTDADYLVKSRNYLGFVDTNTEKMAIATAKFMTEVDYAGIDDGKRYFTKSAAITIETGVNNKIDFKENAGSEVTATIAAGTYEYGQDSSQGYVSFCAAVKTALDAAGATYNVSFNKGTQKFTLDPTTGTTQFLWNTGTNAAICARDELGFDNADTIDAAIHESDNPIVYAGDIAVAGDETSTESVFVGVGLEEKVLAKQNFSLSEYDDIYSAPGDWLAEPIKNTYAPGVGMQHCDTTYSEDGQYGLKLFYTAGDQTQAYYRLFYKKPLQPWTQSSQTVAVIYNGSYSFADWFNGGSFELISRCAIGNDGHGVVVLNKRNAGDNRWDIFGYSYNITTDTLTQRYMAYASSGYMRTVGDITIRDDRCAVLQHGMDTTPFSKIFVSQNTGSGFTSWSDIYPSNHFNKDYPSRVFLQKFEEQSGVDKYRIVTAGRRYSDGYLVFKTWKWDLSDHREVVAYGNTGVLLAAEIDKLGKKNRISLTIGNISTGTELYSRYTNEDYASGLLSSYTSGSDLLSVGDLENYYGYTSSSFKNRIYNIHRRMLILDKKVYFILTQSGSGSYKATIFYTKDITTGTWETPILVGDASGASPQDQEECLVYIPSTHILLAGTKKILGAVSGNTAEGQIFITEVELLGDGTAIARTPEQIDGGEAPDNVFNGNLTLVAGIDFAEAHWNHHGGSNERLWWNEYK